MKVLIVFDAIPEKQKRAIAKVTEEQYLFLSKAHNVILDCYEEEEEGWAEVDIIGLSFAKTQEELNQLKEDETVPRWMPWLKEDLLGTDLSGVDKMIFCGVYV